MTHSPEARRRLPDPPQEYAARATGLRKTFDGGRSLALDGLDLNVPARGIHGFLGPNGSGKTTTIRILLGLVAADSGGIEVLGQPVPGRLSHVIDRVGAIVEQPKFFPTFSGRKNLAILAQGIGVPIRRVGEVLEQVGLADRQRDQFRRYSLGMKQRLSMAATLLKDPELLIFDEPTNGLDPAGIHEFRTAIRQLADAGKTVLVSSHILSEVQQVADTVSIIGRGRLLAEGDVDEILSSGGEAVRVGVRDTARAGAILTAAGYHVSTLDERALRVSLANGTIDPAAVARTLGQQDVWIHELSLVRDNLEAIFLNLTRSARLGSDEVGAA